MKSQERRRDVPGDRLGSQLFFEPELFMVMKIQILLVIAQMRMMAHVLGFIGFVSLQ